MRSPAAAIAWELLRRHRWGLSAVVGYLVGLAILRLVTLDREPIAPSPESFSFSFGVVVPFAITFLYFLAVFSYGLAGDLAGRRSNYPARRFTLPVSSAALAAWPMLFGAAAMALLWLAARLLVVWPFGDAMPLLWPAALGAAILAWTQALTWMPYALPWLRVVVAVLLMVLLDVVVLLALELDASEPVMLAILVPQLPLACLTACVAVARARRGEVPDWLELVSRVFHRLSHLTRRRGHFGSAERAQLWLEWRQYGLALPLLMVMLLPFELSLLFVFRDTPVLVIETVLGVLLTPTLMATFVAARVGRSSSGTSDPRSLASQGRMSRGMAPFLATRPLTDASLLASKLQVTIWSTVVTWLLVLVAVPLALWLSGTSSALIDAAREVSEVVGRPRAVVLGLLSGAVLLTMTWKQLVQSLYVGLSGRSGLIKANVFVSLSLLTAVVSLGQWALEDPAVMAALLRALPLILVVLVILKLSTAAWIAVRLDQTQVLSDRVLLLGAALWALAVLALHRLLVWLVPTLLVRSHLLALIAILAIPLARLSAAPLALSWNRHR